MPDVTSNVVGAFSSNTPCTTGELVCVQPSHILAGGIDNKLWVQISKSELSLLKKDVHVRKKIRQQLAKK